MFQTTEYLSGQVNHFITMLVHWLTPRS